MKDLIQAAMNFDTSSRGDINPQHAGPLSFYIILAFFAIMAGFLLYGAVKTAWERRRRRRPTPTLTITDLGTGYIGEPKHSVQDDVIAFTRSRR